MVFQKMEHVVLYVCHSFLDHGNMVGPTVAFHNMFDAIVEFYLVVEIIHFSLMDIISVQLGIVDFGQEKGIRIFHFDVGIQIAPKFHGYHLGHIKPEPVYT